MRNLPFVLAFVLILLAGGAEAQEPVELRPDPLPSGIRYRHDALLVRLRPAAASLLGALDPALAASPARRDRLGLPGVDRAASALGIRFEREFPGERPPVAGLPGVSGESATDFTAFHIAHLPPGTSAEQALAALRAAPEIESADPIALVPVQFVPNDSLWHRAYYFNQSSGFHLSAIDAWDLSRGDSSIVVGVIDTGVLLEHPDLRGQLWINWVERSGLPGVDDDANGYVDDHRGWDFVALDSSALVRPGEDWRDADNDPNDYVAHGTAVAGIVAAATDNGIGVTSTAHRARIMPLRAGYAASIQPSGWIDLSYVAQALLYATRNGARVVNCSFTSIAQPDLVAAADEAIAQGVVIVAAAGNGQPEHYLPDRDDVIAVAATDAADRLATFSNRGLYVDVSAPGVGISTTSLFRVPDADSMGLRQPTYTASASGTSFAAPFVSGAVALLQSRQLALGLPLLTPAEVQLRIVDGADDIAAANPGLSGYGSGRLNLLRVLRDPPRSFSIPLPAPIVGPNVVLPGSSGSRVAFVTADAHLVLVPAQPGAELETIPLGAAPLGGIAAADLGGERGIGLFVATADDRVAGFAASGDPLPGWPVAASLHRSAEVTQPVLGDLDADGVLEVVLGGNDGRLWAWRADGTPLPGFPLRLDFSRVIRVALADLDSVPGVEMVAVITGGTIRVVRFDATQVGGWGGFYFAYPVDPIVARFGAEPAVIFADLIGGAIARRPDGSVRWSVPLVGITGLPLAAADLDGDGSDEVLVSIQDSVAVIDSAGVVRPSIDQLILPASVPGTPLVGSIVPGGAVVQYVQPGVLVANDASGARVGPLPKPGRAGAWPSIVDLDDDGRTEVVAGSEQPPALHVYELGDASWNENAQAWPTPRANFARTGSRTYAPPIEPDPSTAVLVEQFSAQRRVGGGVAIGWRVAGGSATGLRVERADGASGPWIALAGTPRPEGGLVTVVDPGADPDRAYWYRLIDPAEPAATRVLAVIRVDAASTGAFSLDPVPGNPGPGPFRLRFRLPVAAPVQLEIFDPLGRRIGEVASGTWPAGAHELSWPARGPADANRSGVYLLRFRHPGGEAVRRLVLIRS